jgi:hypothetical protein
MKNKSLTSILLIVILSSVLCGTILENELLLKEQQSKIEEIKCITGEIEKQKAFRLESDSQNEPTPSDSNVKKELKINSDFTVAGSVTATKFNSDFAKVSGNAQIENTLKSNIINTEKITSQSLITERIISTTGVLTIEADLIINNDVMAETVNMRGTSFVLEGVRQWGLVHHDDFESEKSLKDWSDQRTSRCKNGMNTFLGGHCNFSFTEVTKTFKNLPAHEKLKVNAAFHMLDAWEGETAYMKIDGVNIWTRKGQHSPKSGIDICGGDSNDPAFNIPIDVVIPHNQSEITLTFGSTLEKDPCNQSFGIDDVMIYVR